MSKLSSAIKIILIANLIFFGVTFFVQGMQEEMFDWFALYFPQNEQFGIWQFVTSMFMHGGFAHILFNMYALWAFGTPLEYRWGRNKFFFFYFAAGLGAGLIYTAVNIFQFNSIFNELLALGMSRESLQTLIETGKYNPELLAGISEQKLADLYQLYNTPAVGASGAVYGILVAFGMMYPNAKLALIFFPVPIAAKYFIPVLIALDLFSGVTGFSLFGGGIAHFAHIGGAIIGFLLMWYWRQGTQVRRPPEGYGP